MNPNTSLNRILRVAKSVTIDTFTEPLPYYAVEVYDGTTDGPRIRAADVTITGALAKAANGLVTMGVAEAPKQRKPRAVKAVKHVGPAPTPAEMAAGEFIVPTPEQEAALPTSVSSYWDKVMTVGVGEGDE